MVEIFRTDDGSYSLRDKRINETYHSQKGAVQESMHVFIQAGLLYRSQQKQMLRVFEMGFGTGLNALLSYAHLPAAVNLHYTSVEAFPLDNGTLKQLHYDDFLNMDQATIASIQLAPFDQTTIVDQRFVLNKVHTGFIQFESKHTFDLIYYDAFGPGVQPGLWTLECMQKCYDLLDKGGILVTYCAQGQFRRNLSTAGFAVEKLPGPPGKREMTRATKP